MRVTLVAVVEQVLVMKRSWVQVLPDDESSSGPGEELL